MKLKSLLAGSALFLSMVAIGGAKSWDIVVASVVKAGAIQLPAGDYSVKMNGNEATFTASESGQKYTVPAKVENADKKFGETAVETVKKGDTEVMKSIDLGGTNTIVEFGE